MRAFLAFFVLLSLPLPGCDPGGDDPNSQDFGPQPWPGPCSMAIYQNGELQSEYLYYWDDGLLVQLQGVGFIGCERYYYRDDGRIQRHIIEYPCGQIDKDVREYEWGENGQLSSIDYTSYVPNGTTILSRSRGIYTYGPDDELVEVRRSGQDLETDEWAETSLTRYFYDDLGRLVRKEEIDLSAKPDPDYITFMEYHEDEPGFFRKSWDVDGDGTVDERQRWEYDENGRIWHAFMENDSSSYWYKYFDENGNQLKTETYSPGSVREYIYTYDCWE